MLNKTQEERSLFYCFFFVLEQKKFFFFHKSNDLIVKAPTCTNVSKLDCLPKALSLVSLYL